jgi:hypothetical protein
VNVVQYIEHIHKNLKRERESIVTNTNSFFTR